jgi:hypothetical protein
MLRENPIIVTSTMEILEGQHRWAAAKELQVDLYYMISDEVTREDISKLNTNKMNWRLVDYLNFWYSEGKEEYKKISSYANAHPKIPLTCVLMLLGTDYKGVINDFKAGTFEGKSRHDAEILADQLDELSQYGKHVYSIKFLRIYIKIARNGKCDFKKLVWQIQKQPKSFVPCVSDKQYIELFEEIYNRDIQIKNRVSFRD